MLGESRTLRERENNTGIDARRVNSGAVRRGELVLSQIMEKGAVGKWGLIVFAKIGAAESSTTEASATASQCFFLIVESIIPLSFVLVMLIPVQAGTMTGFEGLLGTVSQTHSLTQAPVFWALKRALI